MQFVFKMVDIIPLSAPHYKLILGEIVLVRKCVFNLKKKLRTPRLPYSPPRGFFWGVLWREMRVVLEKPIGHDLGINRKVIMIRLLDFLMKRRFTALTTYLVKETRTNLIAFALRHILFLPQLGS